jgi:hypothetical protein
MLLELVAQLAPNAGRNGDLSMPSARMKLRGWASETTARAALQELESAGLVMVTRRGGKRTCALYAVTLWPLACDRSKLDVPGLVVPTWEWRAGGASAQREPTENEPARWSSLRPKNAKRAPAAGA